MNKIERYTWDNAIIEAGALGWIDAPSVNFALRISRAINWKPKNGKPLGLNWKNETAFKAVGTSRSTYFRVKRDLMDNGFLTQQRKNLVPTMPDNMDDLHAAYDVYVKELKAQESQIETEESQIETEKSQTETEKSQTETEKSQTDTPYSEDIYSEDTYSDVSFSDVSLEASGKPSAGHSPEGNKEDAQPSLISEGNEVGGGAAETLEDSIIPERNGEPDICSEEEAPESQSGTFGSDTPAPAGVKKKKLNYDAAYRIAVEEGMHWHFTKVYGEDVMCNDFERLLDEARALKMEADADDWL